MTNYKPKRKEKVEGCKIISIDSISGFSKNRIADQIKKSGAITLYTPGEYIEKAIKDKKDVKLFKKYASNKKMCILKEIDTIYELYIQGNVYIDFPIIITLDKNIIEYDILRYIYNKFKIPFKVVIKGSTITKGEITKEEVKEYINRNQKCIELLCYLFDYGPYAIDDKQICKDKFSEEELEKISDEITEYLKLVPKQKRVLSITRPCLKSEEKIDIYIDKEADIIYVVTGKIVLRVLEDIDLDNDSLFDETYSDIYNFIDDYGYITLEDALSKFADSISQNENNNFYEIYMPKEEKLISIKKEIAKYNSNRNRKNKNRLEELLANELVLSNGFGVSVIRNEEKGYIRKVIVNIEDRLQEIGIDTIIIESVNNHEIENYAYITTYNENILDDIENFFENKIIDITHYRENYEEKNIDLEKHILDNLEIFKMCFDLIGNYYAYMVIDGIVEKIVYKLQLKAKLNNDNITITAYESDSKIKATKSNNEK